MSATSVDMVELNKNVVKLYDELLEKNVLQVFVNTRTNETTLDTWQKEKVVKVPLTERYGEAKLVAGGDMEFSQLKSASPIHPGLKFLNINTVLYRVLRLEFLILRNIFLETENEKGKERIKFQLLPKEPLSHIELKNFVFRFSRFKQKKIGEFFVVKGVTPTEKCKFRLYANAFTAVNETSNFILVPVNSDLKLKHPDILIGTSEDISISVMNNTIVDFGFRISLDERDLRRRIEDVLDPPEDAQGDGDEGYADDDDGDGDGE